MPHFITNSLNKNGLFTSTNEKINSKLYLLLKSGSLKILSMYFNIKYLTIFVLISLCVNPLAAKDIISDISAPIEAMGPSDMFTENIQIIGASKKIFILTNSNQMMSKGDFITLILNFKDPVARAVVAKEHDGLVGVKILKLYSLKAWSKIYQGKDIQLIRGDDLFLFKNKDSKKEQSPEDGLKIESEEDLFNAKDIEKSLEGDFENDNRHIKPDNVVNLYWAKYSFQDVEGDAAVENHFGGGWAYQFQDNLWVEGVYGRILINDEPAKSKQTLVSNLTLRLKYTFKAPLYSYILPYVGYQNYTVSSPDAGSKDSPLRDEKEINFVKKLSKRNIVFGATILRRMVPGWFLKADLGTDVINIGVAIEF